MTGWTGGQYSVVRAALGIYLALHYAQLAPWGAELFSRLGVLPAGAASPLLSLFPNVLALRDSPAFVTALLWLASVLGALLAIGAYDRLAALGLWYIGACLIGRNPLILNPALPFVGWLLLAHACLPPGPFGSWAARGRVDPRGGWRMPGGIYAAAWVVMAIGYGYSGYTKLVSPSWVDGTALARVLANPLARPGLVHDLALALPAPLLTVATWGGLALELLFAPLALVRRLRPWLWLALLGMHLGLIALIDVADLSLGMVMFHLFTFDPAWVPARRAAAAGPDRVFYDGACGLCRGTVRFLLAEDRAAAFRFAPLDSDAFRTALPDEVRERYPNTIVVKAADGRVLVRSAAVLYLLARLGGLWRVLAMLGSAVPASLRDAAYRGIARVRYRFFAKPSDVCPMAPPDLRDRFDL